MVCLSVRTQHSCARRRVEARRRSTLTRLHIHILIRLHSAARGGLQQLWVKDLQVPVFASTRVRAAAATTGSLTTQRQATASSSLARGGQCSAPDALGALEWAHPAEHIHAPRVVEPDGADVQR